IFFTYTEWKTSRSQFLEEIFSKLSFPIFVKGNHLGSSVGLFKATSESELAEMIDEAFTYDSKVIVEQGISGREIEFAVYGNDCPHAFPPGEVIANGNVYDYAAKYGENSFPTTASAKLTEEQIEEGCQLARKCYLFLGCQGLTRVDFFLDDQGVYWLNEMNPIPGFTQISLFPSICKANGLAFEALIDKLIILGLHKHRNKLRREVRTQ
ncbi:MAG: UDP-N-acetylmuramate--L-alanine ligase, partial [Chlamydiota bacterium]